MRRFINRRTAAWLLYYSGILFLIGMLARWLGTGRPLFLTGHRVLPEKNVGNRVSDVDRMALLSGHAITTRDLEKRLKFIMRLRAAGDPSELTSGMPSGQAFYLTFDDGYRDNVYAAAPVLQKLGVRAVVFLIGDIVRNPGTTPWWDTWGGSAIRNSENEKDAITAYSKRCQERKKISRGLRRDNGDVGETSSGHLMYLSEMEIKQPNQTFYFANHTASHSNLTLLNDAEIAEEIEGGMTAIRDAPNYLPLLAFPFGSYNERVLSYLREKSDIVLAFATGSGSHTDRHCLRRVNLNTSPYCLFIADCVGIFNIFHRKRLH